MSPGVTINRIDFDESLLFLYNTFGLEALHKEDIRKLKKYFRRQNMYIITHITFYPKFKIKRKLIKN